MKRVFNSATVYDHGGPNDDEGKKNYDKTWAIATTKKKCNHDKVGGKGTPFVQIKGHLYFY